MPDPQPSPTSPLDPDEVVSYLVGILRGNTAVKQSDKVAAAAGLANFLLAIEISRLVRLIMEPPEFTEMEQPPQG